MTEAYYDRLRALTRLLMQSCVEERFNMSPSWWSQLALIDAYSEAGIGPEDVCGPSFVGHYSGVDCVFDICSNKEMQVMASVPEELNDIDELARGYSLWEQHFGPAPIDHGDNITIASFSTKLDDASLWISYGKGGYGACLEVTRFHLFSLQCCYAGPVIYDARQQKEFISKMAFWYEKVNSKYGSASRIKSLPSVVSALVKDEQFSFESEFRLVAPMATVGLRLGNRIRASFPVGLKARNIPTTGLNIPQMAWDNPLREQLSKAIPEPPCDEMMRVRLGPAAGGVRRAFTALNSCRLLESERRLR